MRIKNKGATLSAITLLALTAAAAFVNYSWLKMNLRPPVDDEAIHLLSALEYFRILSHPSPNLLGRLLTAGTFYPPLFPFLTAGWARLTGVPGIVPFCMTNVLFLAVTFFSLYGIGLKMGNRKIGILASCFLALYPMFFHLSRMFMLEVALVGMVTLTVMLLLYSQSFSRTSWSVVAGISLGLGMLTKQTCAVFIAGPALCGLLGSWKELERTQKRKRIFNFCLFAAAGIAIAFPWYFADVRRQIGCTVAFSKDRVPFDFPVLSLPSLVFYLKMLAQEQMHWIFFGAFALAALVRLKKLVTTPFLLLWLVIPYAVFTVFPNKFYYYTLASLPAAALITASAILSLKNAAVRRALLCALLILGTGQYLALSFLSPQIHSKILRGTRYSPVKKDYHVQTLLRRVTEESKAEKPMVAVMAIDPNTFFKDSYKRIGENYVLVNLVTLNCSLGLVSKTWTLKKTEDLERNGFKIKPDFLILYDVLEKMGYPVFFSSAYWLSDVFIMPDMSRAYLYKLRDPSADIGKKALIHQEDNRADLDNGLLRLTVADNVWKIFWKGREITKEFSIYTLIESSGRWVDSRLCRWRILSLSKDRLVARAFFSFLLPVQDWEFVLRGNRIYWTVKIFTPFFVQLEWEQASIMLSDAYRRWVTPGESEDFPPAFFKTPNGDWPSLTNLRPSDTSYVGVAQAGEALPAVTFYSLRSRPGLTGQVINSDDTFRGRVLQYAVKHAPWSFLWLWKYEYFRGCIVIGDRTPVSDPGK